MPSGIMNRGKLLFGKFALVVLYEMKIARA